MKNAADEKWFGGNGRLTLGVAPTSHSHRWRMSSLDQSTRTTRENLRRGEETAQQSWSQMERNFATSFDSVRDFQLKTIDMLRAHAESAFDFAEELIAAKSPTDIFEGCRSFAERQVNTLQKQTGELTTIAQETTKETMRPVSEAVSRYAKSA
ncbi:MAG: phasin family protein [Xanthobacteraceae bacterium]